jgi:hypothetical protein
LTSRPIEKPGLVNDPVQRPPHRKKVTLVISMKRRVVAVISIQSPGCGGQSQGMSMENGSHEIPAPAELWRLHGTPSIDPWLEFVGKKVEICLR